jgi:membrane fusion protein (multidrug efflux system)
MPIRRPAGCNSREPWLFPACLIVLLALNACGDRTPPDAASISAPPPAVVAVPAAREAVAEQAQFVGRVVAVDRVDLRARVQGFLQERRFTEGQKVEVGDLLFLIEPQQYQSVLSQREADLAKAVADEENARAQLERGQELAKNKNIAAATVDELRAAQSIAAAGIAQALAAVEAAKLDLGYTEITAPVAGRIGLARYSVGNLVGPSSESLAILVSTDPIYVQFPVTQRDLLAVRRDAAAGNGSTAGVEVVVRLSDGTLYTHKGRLDFVDVVTDAGTDTVTVRAVFPNPDGLLVDGQYVGVLLQQEAPPMAITVPQSALQIDQQGVYVLVVDADSKAQVRRIATGAVKGAGIAVTEGLKAGELVIVEGIQKVRPGQVVSASPPAAPETDPEAVPVADEGPPPAARETTPANGASGDADR